MYDFAIIGGGIIGLSTGMALAMLSNARIVVLVERFGISSNAQ